MKRTVTDGSATARAKSGRCASMWKRKTQLSTHTPRSELDQFADAFEHPERSAAKAVLKATG